MGTQTRIYSIATLLAANDSGSALEVLIATVLLPDWHNSQTSLMKIPTSVIAKFKLAFTPPVHEEVSSLFSRRLAGTPLPIRLEDVRLARQRRSIWKK